MNPSKEERFRQLYQSYKDKVYRLCMGFVEVESEADDLFQEIMIKVWNNLDGFRAESQLGTWVYRIATNTALQSIHKKKRQTEKSAPLPQNLVQTEDTPNENSSERLQMLRRQMAQLKEIDRLILTLLLEGCSYQEIADVTGLSMSNVGVKIKRIKERIRKKMIHHG